MKHIWLLGGVLVLAFASVASAVTIADINNAAAGTYCPVIYGSGCFQIGDKIFRGISVVGPASVTDGNVTVTGEQVADTVFIHFTAGFGASDVQGLLNDWTLQYNVQALAGLIAGIDQSFVPTFGGTSGNASIGETVFADAAHTTPVAQSSVSCILGQCDLADPAPEAIQGDQLVINPPLSRVWVQKDIHLIANVGGLVGATTINQSFHQIPEPAQAAFLLAGLLAVGLYYKSRKPIQA